LEKKTAIVSLPTGDFKAFYDQGALVLDVREPSHFVDGFIPGSIYLGQNFDQGPLLQRELEKHTQLLFIKEKQQDLSLLLPEELLRSEKIKGFLEGGFPAWKEQSGPIDLIIEVDVEELLLDIPFDSNLKMIDTRDPILFTMEHIKGSTNLALEDLLDPVILSQIEEHQNLYLFDDQRSSSLLACSLIKRQGFHNLRNVAGGYQKITTYKDVEVVRNKDGKKPRE